MKRSFFFLNPKTNKAARNKASILYKVYSTPTCCSTGTARNCGSTFTLSVNTWRQKRKEKKDTCIVMQHCPSIHATYSVQTELHYVATHHSFLVTLDSMDHSLCLLLDLEQGTICIIDEKERKVKGLFNDETSLLFLSHVSLRSIIMHRDDMMIEFENTCKQIVIIFKS